MRKEALFGCSCAAIVATYWTRIGQFGMASPEHWLFTQLDFGSFSKKLETAGELTQVVPLQLQRVDGVDVRFVFQFPAVPENGADDDHGEQVAHGVHDGGIDARVVSGAGGNHHD